MELAFARALWLAPDYLLAGHRHSRLVPNSLRRLWTAGRRPLRYSLPNERAHGRALREHDPRGAGKIPSTYSRTFRLRTVSGGEQRSINVMRSMLLATRSHKRRPRRLTLMTPKDEEMAGTTRLELATSAVTGQRSNQLNYVPADVESARSPALYEK